MFDKVPTLRSSAARFRRLLGLSPETAQHVRGTPLATRDELLKMAQKLQEIPERLAKLDG